MSDSQAMLTETADRLFADLASDPTLDFPALWTRLEEAGFPSLLVGEADGGFGGDWLDAAAVLRLAGYHALPAPLAESILAARLLADAGIPAATGLASIAAVCDREITGGRFSGTVKAVAWGRFADTIVAVLGGQLLRLRRADAAEIVQSQSPAGDPRDVLVFDGAPVECAASGAGLFALGAFTRTALIAGALDAALARSIAYANERAQFGRPIGKFQAVQQSLAVFAEEAAAVNCASQAAARALDAGEAGFEIAAAKLRANMAAQVGHATAHQVHGAIGFTFEYDLHRWTRRLIAWGSEFGSERYWSEIVGGQIAAAGADAFWDNMVSRSEGTRRGQGEPT
jgi:acyl-CoA dehydrogenase